MATLIRRAAIVALVAVFPTPSAWAETPEIRIFGSNDEIIAEYQRSGYWGEIAKDSAISVPPYLTIATSPTWDKDSARLPVEVKKELFYRSLLPLILYSNETILEDRTRLEKIGEVPKGADRTWLELTSLSEARAILAETEPSEPGGLRMWSAALAWATTVSVTPRKEMLPPV